MLVEYYKFIFKTTDRLIEFVFIFLKSKVLIYFHFQIKSVSKFYIDWN